MRAGICTLLVCLILSLLSGAAAGTDAVYVLPIEETRLVETDCCYLRITCPLSEEGSVTVSISDAKGQTVYQRVTPDCEGTFRSESIYLKLEGSETEYHVSLTAGAASYDATVRRRIAKLENNTACSMGLPLSALTDDPSWVSVTLLDLDTLSLMPETYPVHASNACTLGSVTFSLEDGLLSAVYTPDSTCDVTVSSSLFCIAQTAVDARRLGSRSFHGLTGTLDDPLPAGHSGIVCVFLRLTVSYTPPAVPLQPETVLEGQEARWRRLVEETEADSNG